MRIFLVISVLLLVLAEAESKLPLNKMKGNIAECVYNSIYPTMGKIIGEYNLANGIDHIDILRDASGKITKCTITDSKFGNARLQYVKNPKTGKKDIQQMSDEWILQNLEMLNTIDLAKSNFDQKIKNKILKARNRGEYKRLMGLVKSGVCKKRIFNLKIHDDGSINTGYHEVVSDGKGKVKTTPIKKDKYANRFINPSKSKSMDAGDKKLLDKIHECTAKTVCPKGDIKCINITKGKLAKSPKSINALMAKASSDILTHTSGTTQKKNTVKNPKQKPNPKKIKQGTRFKSMANAARKSSVYTLLKSVGKPVGRQAAKMSVILLKSVPFVGVAAQVAWDMHVSSQLDEHGRKIDGLEKKTKVNEANIEANKADIMYNRAAIQRLNEEFSILGDSIAENKVQIAQLANQLLLTDEKVEGLSNDISIVASNLSVVASVAQENAKKIEQIKDNFFITGAEELQKYYSTKNDVHLTGAVNNFALYKNIKIDSPEVLALAKQYYIVALSEVHLYKMDSNDTMLNVNANKQDIVNEFNGLMKDVPRRYEMLSIVMNSYVSLLDILEPNEIEEINPLVKDFYKKVVANLIEERRFDTAVFVGENYVKITKDDTLLKEAMKTRQENFNALKDQLSMKNAEEIVDKNENTLLAELAIKKLANNNGREAALKILQQKFITDQTFRYKAYLKLYYELGEDKKYKRLRKLIEENKTYPREIKMIVKDEK